MPAERILALTFSAPAAAEMRERLEALLEAPYEELHVETFRSFCLRLLQDEALEAGVDPFLSPVTPADRLALLLERIDDLSLREHEIRGNPAPLLASFVVAHRPAEGRDGLGGGLPRLRRAADGGGGRRDAARAHAARELEFARLYADHDRLLAERGALDFGDLVLRAFQLLHERPHVRERVAGRFQHVLVDEYQDTNFAAGDAAAAADRRAPAGDGRGRRRPLPRGAARRDGGQARAQLPLRAGASSTRPAAGGCPGRKLTGASGGRVRFWRCRSERAQAQAVAAEAEQLIARRRAARARSACWCAR